MALLSSEEERYVVFTEYLKMEIKKLFVTGDTPPIRLFVIFIGFAYPVHAA